MAYVVDGKSPREAQGEVREGEEEKRQNLIKQNDRDIVLTKIEERRREGRSAKEKQANFVREQKSIGVSKGFQRLFKELCYRYVSFNERDLSALNLNQLVELEKIIARRALKHSLMLKTLCLFPVFGQWAYLLHSLRREDSYYDFKLGDPRPSHAWSYLYMRRRLERVYGSNWLEKAWKDR